METNRRSFLRLVSLALGSFMLFPAMTCNKAGDLISSLRGILNAVEHALSLLGVLQGLLPDSVNTAAGYLLKVTHFVNEVGQILENETIAAADKARQILAMAGDLVFPVIPPPIGPILQAVAGAVGKFLSYFGTDVDNAAAAARGRMDNVPKMDFSPAQIAELKAIEATATKDSAAVMDWKQKAMATPAK